METSTPALRLAGPYVTAAEAAEALRVDYRTLLRAVRAGTLPSVRIGRQVRIPADALCALSDPTRDER